MKTLTELYKGKGTENPISVVDIFFKTVFGSDQDTIDKESKRLRRLSEDLFDPFYKKWEVRFKAGIKAELAEGSSPHTIMKLVPLTTSDEFDEVLSLIDQLLAGDTEEIFAMKVNEVSGQMQVVLQQAQAIFKAEYEEFQEQESRRKVKRIPTILPASR